MELTGIAAGNYECFEPVLFDDGTQDVLRIGAVDKDSIVGAASFRMDEKIGFITSLYVLEKERGKGYGKRLLEALEDLAKEEGAIGVEMDFALEGGEALRSFLEAQGYGSMDQEKICRMDTQELLNCPYVQKVQKALKKNKKGPLVLPFKSLSAFQRNKLYEKLKNAGMLARKENLPDFDDELSFASMDEMENVAAILFSSSKDNTANVDLLYSFYPRNPEYAVSVLGGFVEMLDKKYREGLCGSVTMLILNDSVKRFTDILTENGVNLQSIGGTVFAWKAL